MPGGPEDCHEQFVHFETLSGYIPRLSRQALCQDAQGLLMRGDRRGPLPLGEAGEPAFATLLPQGESGATRQAVTNLVFELSALRKLTAQVFVAGVARGHGRIAPEIGQRFIAGFPFEVEESP